MTKAIGTPAANAPAIDSVNAKSKFISGRALPTNMLLFSTARQPPPGRSGGDF
jgi:hypothetical protein